MNEDRIITLAVSEDSGGTRLDAYISSQIEELSRNYAQQIIESGCVSVNGKEELSKKAKVKSGDSIEIDCLLI